MLQASRLPQSVADKPYCRRAACHTVLQISHVAGRLCDTHVAVHTFMKVCTYTHHTHRRRTEDCQRPLMKQWAVVAALNHVLSQLYYEGGCCQAWGRGPNKALDFSQPNKSLTGPKAKAGPKEGHVNVIQGLKSNSTHCQLSTATHCCRPANKPVPYQLTVLVANVAATAALPGLCCQETMANS